MHTKFWSENLRAREIDAEGRKTLQGIKTGVGGTGLESSR
jgi:hypothetical protein